MDSTKRAERNVEMGIPEDNYARVIIVIKGGGSNELLEELQKMMEASGWSLSGFQMDASFKCGDGETPAPMFFRPKE